MRSLLRLGFCLVLGLASGCGDDEGPREQDVAANKAILDALPRFPDAIPTDTHTSPFYDEGDDTPRGYTSAVIYRAPRGTADHDVIRFYRAKLTPRWRCGVERTGVLDLDHPRRKEAPLLALVCRRERQTLVVNTDSMPQFDVTTGPERA